jgi:hypothetical protein
VQEAYSPKKHCGNEKITPGKTDEEYLSRYLIGGFNFSLFEPAGYKLGNTNAGACPDRVQ